MYLDLSFNINQNDYNLYILRPFTLALKRRHKTLCHQCTIYRKVHLPLKISLLKTDGDEVQIKYLFVLQQVQLRVGELLSMAPGRKFSHTPSFETPLSNELLAEGRRLFLIFFVQFPLPTRSDSYKIHQFLWLMWKQLHTGLRELRWSWYFIEWHKNDITQWNQNVSIYISNQNLQNK